MSDPIKAARDIFDESLSALMAHTIRASVNHFRKNGLELDVRIIADSYQVVTNGSTSVLKSKLVGKNLRADIFLHPHANKHLARICIAHEIYHLLMELQQWRANNRVLWAPVPNSKEAEDKCNQFAWELCRLHDKFNRNDHLRGSQVLFPQAIFDAPLNTDISRKENWPLGMEIDSANPFTKRPPIDF